MTKNKLLILLIGISIFYLYHLCPSVYWGDSGSLQAHAFHFQLDTSAHGHFLYQLVGLVLVKLLFFLEPALVINLVSAVFGVLTLVILYKTVSLNIESELCKISTILIALVAYSFWKHAAIAEIYTMTLFFQGLVLYRMLKNIKEGNGCSDLVTSYLLGAGLMVHIILALLMPSYFLYLICVRGYRLKKAILNLSLVFLGALPLLGIALVFKNNSIREIFFGMPVWQQEMVSFSIFNLPQDLKNFGLYFIYNYFFASIFVAIGVYISYKNNRCPFWLLCTAGVVFFLFALDYRVPDQYVFYLPLYYIFNIWLASGLAWLEKRIQLSSLLYVVMVGMVGFTVAVYSLLPSIITTFRLTAYLPFKGIVGSYKGGVWFYLFPGRHGYTVPRRTMNLSLSMVEPNSILLMGWDLYGVYHYMKNNGEIKEQVEVFMLGPEFWEYLEHNLDKRDVYVVHFKLSMPDMTRLHQTGHRIRVL